MNWMPIVNSHKMPLGLGVLSFVLLFACTNTPQETHGDLAEGPSGCEPDLVTFPQSRELLSAVPVMLDLPAARKMFSRAFAGQGDVPPSRAWVLVDTAGYVRDFLFTRATGDPSADSLVRTTGRRLRFAPGTYRNDPVCVWLNIALPSSGAVE